jgi:hypothetical protein
MPRTTNMFWPILASSKKVFGQTACIRSSLETTSPGVEPIQQVFPELSQAAEWRLVLGGGAAFPDRADMGQIPTNA